MPVKRSRNNSLYGFPNPSANQFPDPIVTNRAPAATDQGEPGQLWIDQVGQTAYVFIEYSAGSAVWGTAPSGGTSATSFTVNPGNLTVTAGNVIVSAGDVTASSGTGTFGSLAAGNSVITGTLDVSGASTFTDATFVGNVTVTGDFDITDTASISITSTNNAAGAITLLANGGTNETIVVQSAQGTGAGAVTIDAAAGGVTIQGGLATADAINILSGATGGIDVDYGSAGMTITGANGAFSLASGTGAINIGADAAAHTITMGNSTGATSLVFNCGTGALNIGTNAVAHTITMGNVTGATAVNINTGTGGSTYTTTNGALSFVTGTGAINIGADAAAKTITMGNVTGATAVAINTGTGGYAVTTTGTGDVSYSVGDDFGVTTGGNLNLTSQVAGAGAIDIAAIDATGTVLMSGAGGMTLSTTNNAFNVTSGTGAINIGTDAAAHTVTVGNITGATAVNINSGTGGSAITTTNGILALVTGTGTINMGTDSVAKTINIGNSAGATAVNITTGTGGMAISATGLVSVVPSTASVASPTASSTQNFNVIRTTFTGFTTAMSASQDFTITSSKILTTSGILVSVANLNASGNGAVMTKVGVTQAAGSIVVHTTNNGAGALGAGDDVLITVWVIS